jgi:hypothetical protein
MTVQDNYINDMVYKIIEKNHSEELHNMYLEYLFGESETGNEKWKWKEYINEVESRIGMKVREKDLLEQTEEHKNLLIAKLEEELNSNATV